MDNKVFVGGLSWEIHDEDLEEIFSSYGKILDAEVKYYGSQPRGFGYVTFEDAKGAKSAITAMKNKEVTGRKISVRSYQHPTPSKVTSTPLLASTSTSEQQEPIKEQKSEPLTPFTGLRYFDVLHTPTAPRKDPHSQLDEAMLLIASLRDENKALKAEIHTLSMRVSKLETEHKISQEDMANKVRVDHLEEHKQHMIDQLQSSKQQVDKQKECEDHLQAQLKSLQEMHRKFRTHYMKSLINNIEL